MLEIGIAVGFEDMGGGSDGEGSPRAFLGAHKVPFGFLVPRVGFHCEII